VASRRPNPALVQSAEDLTGRYLGGFAGQGPAK
jgi:hypothetical protein